MSDKGQEGYRRRGYEDSDNYGRHSHSTSRHHRKRSSSSSSNGNNDGPSKKHRHKNKKDTDSRRKRRSRSRSRSRSKDRSHHKRKDHEHKHKRKVSRRSPDERSPKHHQRSQLSSEKDVSTPTEPSGISMKIPASIIPSSSIQASVNIPRSRTTAKVAAIFAGDDDSEPEEMPPEAKMRMKNIGRDTPTSAGPNSFGKTKIGFCNAMHLAEREMEAKQLSNTSGSKRTGK